MLLRWSGPLLSTILAVSAMSANGAAAACYPGLGNCVDENQKPAPLPLPTQPAAPAQPAPPAQLRQPTVEYHYVGPVFPPDPWLALRSEPSSKRGHRLMKMPEGTMFRLLDTKGPWYKVRLRDGMVGWTHSGWVKCCRELDR
jgi:Bacterial SH3 domain